MELIPTENFDSIYWSYNCPLQMWPVTEDPEDENSKVLGWRVVNYMPRKESCSDMGDELVSKDELKTYCNNASKVLRNLASLFDALAENRIDTIYYPDEQIKPAEDS